MIPMMVTMNAYTALAQRIGPFLFDIAWKSLAFALLMALLAPAVRRASAARRHLIWLVTVYGLLSLPVLTLLLPARQFSLPAVVAAARLPLPVLPAQTAPQANEEVSTPAPTDETSAATTVAISSEAGRNANASMTNSTINSMTNSTTHLSNDVRMESGRMSGRFVLGVWSLWAAGVWGMGVGIVLLQMLMGLVASQRRLQRCQKTDNDTLTSALRQAQTALALARPCSLYVGVTEDFPVVPMTRGVFHPIILLPCGAQNWPAERLLAVLLHELAHVKRADWLTQMAAMFACALYWFNPSVWMAARRLRLESEYACDDLALTAGIRATDYAQHLLAIAQALHTRCTAPMMVTMAQRPDIQTRLHCILADSRNRQPLSRRGMLAALTLAFGLLSPLAVWQTQTAAQTTPRPAPSVERAAPSAEVKTESLLRPVRLPDGAEVQLDSIAGQLEDGQIGRWQPDGSGLTRSSGEFPALQPGMRRIAARLKFPSRQAGRDAVVLFGVQGMENYAMGLSTVTKDGKPADYLMTSYDQLFPATQQRVTMVLKVAATAPQIVISGPPQRSATRRFGTGETALLSKAYTGKAMSQGRLIAIHGVKLILSTRFVKDCDYRLQYVDQAGKIKDFKYMSGTIPDTTGPQTELRYIFRVSEAPLAQIKAFRFQSRPFQTAVFRNVALQPTARALPVTPARP